MKYLLILIFLASCTTTYNITTKEKLTKPVYDHADLSYQKPNRYIKLFKEADCAVNSECN